jgi:YhcH/YjgK/YiaL family protein
MQHEKITPAIAAKWFNGRDWAQGLKLEAHKSTDAMEFYFQYARNREYWDKALAWLRDTDPEQILAGKYKLLGDQVYVLVSEGPTKDLKDARWEAHQKYIDIQYVASGKEKIGVAPLSKAVGIEPFSVEKDIGFFEIPESDCRYSLAEPGTFFVFFPQDAHRPGIKVKGCDTDKKIVIKIRVG